jgi:hypothetical protein
MKKTILILFTMLSSWVLAAEVLDRVAVSIGNQVITESQLIQEIKLNSFLNNEPPNFSTAAKRESADRLIEQKLVRKEMDLGHYPSAAPAEAVAIIQNLLKTRVHGREEFDLQLKAAGITFAELQDHLLWGLTLSHFVDLRFRPAVQVTNRDVTRYYQEKIVPTFNATQKPTLDDVRTRIEETLRAERSDGELDTWLKDTRSRTPIQYQKEVFGEADPK